MLLPQQTHRAPACRDVLIQVPASALFHLNFLTFKLLHHLGNSVSFCKPRFNELSSSTLSWPSLAELCLCTVPMAACPHWTRCDTQQPPHYLHVCVPVPQKVLGLLSSLHLRPQHSAWQIVNCQNSEERSRGINTWMMMACFSLSASYMEHLCPGHLSLPSLSSLRREWAPLTKI